MSGRSVVASAIAAAGLAAALAGCDGCSDGTKQPTSTPPATSDAGTALSRHRLSPDAAATEHKPGCRLVTAEESQRPETARWMSAPGVTVRVLETGREWRLQGDDVLPCAAIGNVEVTLVARGNAENLAGGEGAGAEAWLASPCVAVRAMGAAHRITVKDDTCILHVSGGTLLAWVAPDAVAAAEGGAPDAGASAQWRRLDPRTDLTWRFDPKKPTPAVEACEAAAAGMDRVAAAMAKGALGQAAADSAIIRASVRGACAIARTRLRLVAPDAGEHPLDKRIDAAVARGLGVVNADAGPPR